MRGLDRARVIAACSLLASFVLYLAGVRFVLPAACVAAGVYVLPTIPVLSSLVGRLFASTALFFAVFQVAATVQFLVWPSSDFRMGAALATAVYLVAVLLAGPETDGLRAGARTLVNRHDAAGAIVGAIFLLPFVPILVGDHTVARVAQIGGGQASDGATHFAMIAQLMQQQHLNYATGGSYYPQGFHITVAFLQDSLSISQTSGSWRAGVLIYIGQYLVFGTLLAGAIGYFLSGVLAALAERYALRSSRLLVCAAGIATGVIATLFLLLPFVENGFLNYYYALATILLAFGVLLAGAKERLFPTVSLYLVFIFGAGLSWPLLLPPLLASLALFLCRKGYLRSLLALPKRQLLGIGVLVGMQFIPIGFQFWFSQHGASQGINLRGTLTAFHPLSLLLSALIVAGLAASGRIDRELKERSTAILLPLLAFTGLLALMQLFVVGEVRYYVIKVAFLLEALNTVFLACLVAVALSRLDIGAVVRFCAAAVLPAAVILSLFAVTADPLSDVRNLFRTAAHQVKPNYFDADLGLYAALGNAGRVDDFNTTVLHYDSATKQYSAHMQIPFWANMMRYRGTAADFRAMVCNVALLENLSGPATDAEQAALVNKVKECAGIAREGGREYIIVTDPLSVDAVEAEFGGVVRVETYAH